MDQEGGRDTTDRVVSELIGSRGPSTPQQQTAPLLRSG
jgi:hypothetical protein